MGTVYRTLVLKYDFLTVAVKLPEGPWIMRVCASANAASNAARRSAGLDIHSA